MNTHWVLIRSSKCANVRYRKIKCFYSFIINSQSKLKRKTAHWDICQEILAYRFWWFYGGFFELEILEMFPTAYLLKTIIWTWIFIKYCGKLSLKTKHKIFSKNLKTTLNIGWHSKRQKKILKKEKGKRKIRKSYTAIMIIFLLLLFDVEKFTFC